jgi:hypothetical protein
MDREPSASKCPKGYVSTDQAVSDVNKKSTVVLVSYCRKQVAVKKEVKQLPRIKVPVHRFRDDPRPPVIDSPAVVPVEGL